MNITVTVQIGNSDDKLTQQRWARYAEAVGESIRIWASEVHFSGASLPFAPWQNAAWVFVVPAGVKDALITRLTGVRLRWEQDSIAWTEGETKFI